MIPAANNMKVSGPPIGRSASAACAAVSIWVMPCVLSVAAVVTMMKKAMALEKDMPIQVSIEMLLNEFFFKCGCSANRWRWLSLDSSASCDACQKNK
jgi:hypothetical protein